jgi:hypothetical protein
MAIEKPTRAKIAELLNQGSYSDRLYHLVGWAEILRNDLGDLIGALNRLQDEMQSVGKPASRDFLTAVNSNKE